MKGNEPFTFSHMVSNELVKVKLPTGETTKFSSLETTTLFYFIYTEIFASNFAV